LDQDNEGPLNSEAAEEAVMARDVEPRKGGGLSFGEGAVMVVVAVVGIIVAFAALSFIAGALWELIKIVVLVAIVGGVIWFLVGRRK
jgi:hypothetical protein